MKARISALLLVAGVLSACPAERCRDNEVAVDGTCRVACNSDLNCARDQHCEDGACVTGVRGGSSSGSASSSASAPSSSVFTASSAGPSSAAPSSSTTQVGSSAAGPSSAATSSLTASSSSQAASSASSAEASSTAGASSVAVPSSTSAPASSAAGASSAASSASSGPADADMDGVEDGVDNCRMVHNPGQENEDGDLHGDACDNCPVTDNNPQANGDGDGLGDACDPRPSLPGDFLAFFDGFNGTTLAAGWTVRAGTWSVGAGALHQADATIPLQPLIHRAAMTIPNAAVQTAFIMTDCAQAPCRAGPLVGVTTAGDGWACSLSGETSTSAELGFTPMTGWTLVNTPVSTVTAPHPLGAVHALQFTRIGENLQCRHVQSDTVGSHAAGAEMAGGIGLRTRRARASFLYVIAYGR